MEMLVTFLLKWKNKVETRVAAAMYSMVMGRFLTRFITACFVCSEFIWKPFILYPPFSIGYNAFVYFKMRLFYYNAYI